MNDNFNSLLKNARNSISDFCMNECKSLCCRKGKLILLSDLEITAVVGDKKNEYLKDGTLVQSESGNLIYDFSKVPCKNLFNESLCKIHKSNSRPKVCQDYPLFLKNNYVIKASTCPAIENGLIDKELKEIEKLGYIII